MNLQPDHVAFTVKDFDKSIKWYEDILGLKLVHNYKKHGMKIAQMQLENGFRIELFSYDEGIQDLPDYRKNLMDDLHVIGTKHICFKTDNLDETIKTLKIKGVEFATEIDTAGFGGRYIFIEDCNGILIELYES